MKQRGPLTGLKPMTSTLQVNEVQMNM